MLEEQLDDGVGLDKQETKSDAEVQVEEFMHSVYVYIYICICVCYILLSLIKHSIEFIYMSIYINI